MSGTHSQQGSHSQSPKHTPGLTPSRESTTNPLAPVPQTVCIARNPPPCTFIATFLDANIDDELFPPVPEIPLPAQIGLPAAYGAYQPLIRDQIREVEYPSLAAATPRLTQGIPEQELANLANDITIAYNTVMESADVAASLAEEAQRHLAQ
ncbi:hypothetical protein WOLCODRAFT_147236 [Wolfiporia cocos MD-104 SS10]|uniref:Uncharacterized protein n=1 Tax=Wolfiporia cocos (strain MD-104) TaxID=742152 RepID=A0A2H3IT24_WOLCO|nr:hypothetical protein WOLCODRAFT_147236 [Wolfiporia cocos MD-104 SS10]